MIRREVAHHQAGQLLEAERIYRAVLDADPQHGEAMNFLGVIAMQTGNLHDAEMWPWIAERDEAVDLLHGVEPAHGAVVADA